MDSDSSVDVEGAESSDDKETRRNNSSNKRHKLGKETDTSPDDTRATRSGKCKDTDFYIS